MGKDEIPIKSSSIARACYVGKGRTLQVMLRDGRIYRYHGVPEKVYRGIMESTDHIKYLRHIDSKFTATEIHPEGAAKTEQVRIQNFRSILDMTIKLDDLTMLIGANSTGKTTVLEAIGLFGSDAPSVSYHDIGRGLDQLNITLSIRVSGYGVPSRFLTNGMVELRRTFTTGNPGNPHTAVAVMLNKDFDGIRNARTVNEKRREISKAQKKYPDFPALTTALDRESKFSEYEHRLSLDPKHQAKYSKRFISFSRDEIALSKILEVTAVLATRDIVTDASEGDASSLSGLMDLAVRSSERLQRARRLVMTIDEADAHTHQFGDTHRDLSKRLRRNSERYMTGAEFTADLLLPGRQPDVLKASVRMKDGEFMEDVVRAGSGAQRAYLFSLLDTIAELRREARERDQGSDHTSPVRLIAIDEPELHQHPQRQRQIMRSLVEVADDPSVRIVCSTHSPHFVKLKRADTLRILRRGKKKVWFTTREQLVGLMRPRHRSVEDGWKKVSQWLDMSVTSWAADGFFSKLVVITEGAGDRNMLLAASRVLGLDLDKQEITIVSAEGVQNVEGFLHLFKTFGIPTYAIWDMDHEQHERNQKLADVATGKMFEGSLNRTTINGNFACVEGDMTEALLTELHSCADILSENHRYVELEKARTDDEKGSKRRKPCDASKKAVRRAQKGFLNDKLNVIDLLEAVDAKDHERLKSFTVARIVLALQEVVRSH